MSAFKDYYRETIAPELEQELGIKNKLAIPRLTKVIVNMGIGKARDEKDRLTEAQRELSVITGQKPVITKARISVSNFKLRAGMSVGMKVTLRGVRMYDFLQRLIHLALPRVRDFRGLSPKSFDGRGNFNFGVTDQSIFPEVRVDKIKYQQGMDICICTSTDRDEHARKLLEKLNFPFRKQDEAQSDRKAS